MFPTDSVDAQVQFLRRCVHEAETRLHHLKLQLEHVETGALHAQQQRIGQNLEPEWQAEVMAALTHGSSNNHNDNHSGNEDDDDHDDDDHDDDSNLSDASSPSHPTSWWPQQQAFALSSEEYKRFGRQLIMPEIGLQGQLRLKSARVLVVGAGGLGCPAATYLAAAGVGTLGLVDGDTVELSNLHRQIAHSTDRVGRYKVDSAIEYISGLNPNVKYIPYRHHLAPSDALDLFAQYDVVLDCTDHPTSRYLISDACVLAGKPLVSASALRTEGQLTVLNNPPRLPGSSDGGGPCYRCVFPKPPPAASVMSCSEGGILGPVVGLMGVLQALEAIKLIARGIDDGGPPTPASGNADQQQQQQQQQQQPAPAPSMLLFSAYSLPQFRNVRLRSRRADCAACSAAATITPQALTSGSMDYVAFCGATEPINVLDADDRLNATEFAKMLLQQQQQQQQQRTKGDQSKSQDAVVILDVRDQTQFELCSLPNSINIPWSRFADKIRENEEELKALEGRDVVVVCKLGNDSQLAAKILKDTSAGQLNIKDVRGGFRAWRDQVDPSWPDY